MEPDDLVRACAVRIDVGGTNKRRWQPAEITLKEWDGRLPRLMAGPCITILEVQTYPTFRQAMTRARELRGAAQSHVSEVYKGWRTRRQPSERGECHVTVNDRPLHHYAYHSPDGFEWGYVGSGPADLALAILAHHFGERPTRAGLMKTGAAERYQSYKYHQVFKDDFVAGWGDTWQLTSDQIEAWLLHQQTQAFSARTAQAGEPLPQTR
jgi:hypothetical protein